MRTRIAGGLFPATLRVPGRVTTLKEKTSGGLAEVYHLKLLFQILVFIGEPIGGC